MQRFIGREYGFDRRRELARSALGYSADAWARYAEFGLLALPFPEEVGGLGGNAVDIMLVMELMGRGLLLEPFLSTIVMCGGLMRDAGPAPLKRQNAAADRRRGTQSGARLLRGCKGAMTCRSCVHGGAQRRGLALERRENRGARRPFGRLFFGVRAQFRPRRRAARHFRVPGRTRGRRGVAVGLSHAVGGPCRRCAARRRDGR